MIRLQCLHSVLALNLASGWAPYMPLSAAGGGRRDVLMRTQQQAKTARGTYLPQLTGAYPMAVPLTGDLPQLTGAYPMAVPLTGDLPQLTGAYPELITVLTLSEVRQMMLRSSSHRGSACDSVGNGSTTHRGPPSTHRGVPLTYCTLSEVPSDDVAVIQ